MRVNDIISYNCAFVSFMQSTASDLSCDDDDFVGTPNVSFAEFLQQYRELTEWLNQVQKGTQRDVTSLSEKYLNQVCAFSCLVESFI